MKRRGRKLVDLSLAKEKTSRIEAPKKTTRTRVRETSPVPEGNEREIAYFLECIGHDLDNISDQENDDIGATKKVGKISSLSSPLGDKNSVPPLLDLQNNNVLNTKTPSKKSAAEDTCIGNIVSEKGLDTVVTQNVCFGASMPIVESNLISGCNLPSALNLQNYNIVESVIIEESIAERFPNESITEKMISNVGDILLPVDLSSHPAISDVTSSSEQILSFSDSILSAKEDLPYLLVTITDTNVTNSQLTSKNAEQETGSKNESLLAPEHFSSSDVNMDVVATGSTVTNLQLMSNNLEPGRCSLNGSLLSAGISSACIVNAVVTTDSEFILNESVREGLSKPTSPSLKENTPDLQIDVPCRSETNMEPIGDDLYPNLSIQSADMVLDSPCSSFNIPSPNSSVNSPGATKKKKRNCEKRKGPGKIRTTNFSEWKDVKNKMLKNLGREYANRKGEKKEEKKIKPPCGDKCIKKCSERIEGSEREHVFKCYWELGSHERQWDFISKYVSSHEPKRIKAKGPNRSRIMKYTLPKNSDNTAPVTVCRTMFLNTLSISEKTVRTLFNKQSSVNENMHKVTDLRGKHRNRPKKLGDNILNSVKDHINALAPVESHYCRKSSTKKYLDGLLSYKRLHLLYLEWFDEQIYGNKKATLRQYQDIVNSNFNIAFYTPKKDQCDKCHAYKNMKQPTEEQKTEHDLHLKYKTLARSLKETDKSEAEKCQNGEIVTACFDMQKILTCPFGDVSIFYYKRKLNLYNFTVYNMAQKTGYCYMWSEVNGKKGANEICSGLMSFMISKIDGGTKQFKFWSDNCSGQNRNRIVFAFYQYVVGKYDVESITHRFLEVGHTQNEGDSVHSVIEGASKNMTIYTPEQWFNLIRWAKTTGEAYRVKEMTVNDVYDYRVLLGGKYWKKNDENEKVAWNKVKEIHVTKENINLIKYKYQLDEDYKTITTLKKKTRGKTFDVVVNIKRANTSHLKIMNDKYRDLTYLCEKNIIPEEFHSYYKSLPCDKPECVRSNNDDNNDEDDESDED